MRLQVTAVFLVDASECFPTAQEWPKIWEEQQAWRKGKAEHEAKLAAEQVRWHTSTQISLAAVQ